MRGFVLSGEESFLRPNEMGRAAEREAIQALAELERDPRLAAARLELAAVADAAANWRTSYAGPAVDARRAGVDPPPAAAGRDAFDNVRAATRAAGARPGRDPARGARRARRRARGSCARCSSPPAC